MFEVRLGPEPCTSGPPKNIVEPRDTWTGIASSRAERGRYTCLAGCGYENLFSLQTAFEFDSNAAPVIFEAGIGTNIITDRKIGCKIPFASYYTDLHMAKTSWLERNDRKKATVAKYAAIRAELKAKGDYVGLQQLPRDASPTRVVNRCVITGRRRAFIRRFQVSRITFRELASHGLIPGVTKSSW